MNAVLQCLSNTPSVRNHFVAGCFEESLNLQNPHGTKGKLSHAFARLLSYLWKGDYTVIAPRRFKAIIGQVDVSYLGYDQHDAQEFLGFLLVQPYR